MDLSQTQRAILTRLKTRGAQSIKILSNQLDMTTMGVRQHIRELKSRDLVTETEETRQTRGRPVHLWQLTRLGHQQFDDRHGEALAQLLTVIEVNQGPGPLQGLVESQHRLDEQHYREELALAGEDIESKLQRLAELRSEAGYMAEIRLLPDGWMLIENHCPIFKAASACQHYCRSELDLFRALFRDLASVEITDHLLSGARRCAYEIHRL